MVGLGCMLFRAMIAAVLMGYASENPPFPVLFIHAAVTTPLSAPPFLISKRSKDTDREANVKLRTRRAAVLYDVSILVVPRYVARPG